MIGKTILHYKITEKLGEGGMGVVYKVEDTKLKRLVAIKFLPRQIAVSDDERERFKIEAQAAAALNHPNIATIHAIEEVDGEMFIVMEFIDGQELRKKVASDQLPVNSVIDIAMQIAEGLKAAHAKGVTHRDIKSSNIMVTESGQVKIMDFGLAKIAGGAQLTKDHSTLGTAAYMSPEQARGENVDHRTDIWAFGVVLYEMLTGQLPFRGVYEAAIAYSILNEDPPPINTLRLDTPEALQHLVNKALAKKVDERYQSAKEMLDALRQSGNQTSAASIGERPTKAVSPNSKRSFLYAAFGGLTILLIAGIIYFRQSVEPASRLDSIAVLPLANLSGDPEQEYFSDGMTEELINNFGKVEGLKVAARTSSFTFKGKEADVREIGRKLGVTSVLEGSVRKVDNQVRIIARLVSVEDGYQLWSETYVRELKDVFAIQNEISQAIANALQTKLQGKGASSSEHPTEDLQAYDFYLKGRYLWNRRTEHDLKKAVAHFQQAVTRAPTYARAHLGLADAYAVLGFYDWLPPQEAFPKAREATQKALELDATLFESQATLGYISLYYDWNWPEAERHFQRAIELNPRYPVAHQWYANYLVAMGRFDEAAHEMRHGLELDPLSLINSGALGWVYYHAGQHDRAIEQCQATLALDSNFVLAYFWMGQACEQLRQFNDAVQKLEFAVNLSKRSAIIVAGLAHTYALAGKREAATKVLAELEAAQKEKYVPAYEMAKAYFALDQEEKAFALLEKAYEQRSHSMVFLNVDPQLQNYRSNRKFVQLLNKVGLQP